MSSSSMWWMGQDTRPCSDARRERSARGSVALGQDGCAFAKGRGERARCIPVLLRLDYDAGHGVGTSRSQRVQETADIYSFCCGGLTIRNFNRLPLPRHHNHRLSRQQPCRLHRRKPNNVPARNPGPRFQSHVALASDVAPIAARCRSACDLLGHAEKNPGPWESVDDLLLIEDQSCLAGYQEFVYFALCAAVPLWRGRRGARRAILASRVPAARHS